MNNRNNIVALIAIALFYITTLTMSWLVICGLLKFLTWIFGLGFNLKVSTGTWLLIVICFRLNK